MTDTYMILLHAYCCFSSFKMLGLEVLVKVGNLQQYRGCVLVVPWEWKKLTPTFFI